MTPRRRIEAIAEMIYRVTMRLQGRPASRALWLALPPPVRKEFRSCARYAIFMTDSVPTHHVVMKP
jgi:hypothetical protein